MNCDGNGRITERHVQAIWYDRELRPEKLHTRTGESVRVVYPGDWNSSAGPDFRHAVLELGRERRKLVGDVEIHLTPSDWDAHGHGCDPDYRHVIAHVTWRDGMPPSSLPSGAVSICLGRFLASDMNFSADAIDVGAYPFDRSPAAEQPCRQSARDDPARVRGMLADAGRWRIKAKAGRLSGRLCAEGMRQVFYSEVMKALGYSKNSRGFQTIAETVPYEVVEAEPENLIAAFLTAAEFVDWDRTSLRPNNAPERRLEAAARLFSETDVMSLIDVNDSSQSACRKYLSILTSGGHVGKGRAAAILANVIVPLAMACGTMTDVPSWLPPEDVCEPVRRVARRMFGGDHNPKTCYATNGLLIQGLIQVGREWCEGRFPECIGCPAVAA